MDNKGLLLYQALLWVLVPSFIDSNMLYLVCRCRYPVLWEGCRSRAAVSDSSTTPGGA